MLVGEVMNRNVKTARPDDRVVDAVKIMDAFRIGSLIVLDGSGLLAGIVTERDVLRKIIVEGRDPNETKVSEIMTAKVVTVPPEASLEDAANLMTKNNIKKLPVILNGQLVGVVTASDLINYESELVEKVGKLLLMKGTKGFGG